MFANRASERLIGDALTIRKGDLTASHREQRDAFNGFLFSVLRKDTGAGDFGPIVLPRPSGRQPALVRAIPLSAAPEVVGFQIGGSAALIS